MKSTTPESHQKRLDNPAIATKQKKVLILNLNFLNPSTFAHETADFW